MHVAGMRNHKDHSNAKLNSSTHFDLITKHFQNDSIDMTEDTHITNLKLLIFYRHVSLFLYILMYIYTYIYIYTLILDVK